MEEDDSLYNAMIWALSIGIVIVIATLIITKPAPESFTELYFNNHTLLPEYASTNTKYNYSFSIHNLENQNMTYDYTITTSLYDIDYSCTTPTLYLEDNNNTQFTETNDPALIIKDDSYNITFNYETKSGDNTIYFRFVDINNKKKYDVTVSPYTVKFNNQFYPITTNTTTHKFTLMVNPINTTIRIDNDRINVTTPKDYTKGFPSLGTLNTYAEFSNMQIQRRDAKQNVYVRIADQQYKDLTLSKQNEQIEYSRFLADNNQEIYSKVTKDQIIEIYKNTTSYYSIPVNITNSTIRLTFPNNDILAFGFDSLDILFNPLTSELKVDSVISHVITKSSNELLIKTIDDDAIIYFNGKNVTQVKVQTINVQPYIQTLGPVTSFTIKSNDQPITINYKVQENKPIIQYSPIFTPQSLATIFTPLAQNISNDDQSLRMQELYDLEKMDFTNYRLTATYLDRKKNQDFKISMETLNATIFSLQINGTTNKANILYIQNNITKEIERNITVKNLNNILFDVNNGSMIITVNDVNVLYTSNLTTNNGIIVFDYGNVTLTNAQAQDRDSTNVKVYRKQNILCEPLLTNTYTYTNSTTVPDKGIATLNGFVQINEIFDTAKVQVSLSDQENRTNNQEIHFIVKNI